MPLSSRSAVVVALGITQTLAWASSYYLPAMLAAPMAKDLGIETPTVFAGFSFALVISAFLGPYAGRCIDRWGGRPVLMATNLVFAAGLLLLGMAHSVVGLLVAWAVLGIGMGSGLYEAAFAGLVRLYGRDSRSAITGITLFAGFASTIGWPLSTLLEAQYGWRGACFGWAALHVCLGLPLNALLPKAAAIASISEPAVEGASSTSTASSPLKASVLLSIVFAITWFISTAMAAHLPRLLMAGGATLAAAVAFGALVGPAQVGARILEFGLLRNVHPLLSARLATLMHPIGAALMALAGAPLAAVFVIFHGAGNGILTIAKGTLPLVLFGPQGYGARQGLLMVPARIAQALAPWLFGVCLDRWGAGALWLSGTLGLVAFGALMALRSKE
ncbi:MFS transporter [uncultured Xylophilus sp.]|uniref:MFS transporter n=1 Tax=uncultured Xylophilus sp. TaxID=296832 RepID=UPI0011F82964|nr:MFS transporter [uncultured Xylophilus sp.]RZL45953.1 MAG: MFS transporter [Variovorax sp.]